MEKAVISLINALAPTVGKTLIDVIEKRKVKTADMNVVLVALMAEQNNNTMKFMDEMGKQMVKLSDGMNRVLKEIKTVNEGIMILLKRTES